MERILIILGTIIAGISFYTWTTSQVTSATKIQKEKTAIHSIVEQYKKSIDDADTILGSKIWAHTIEVSQISPEGIDKGWESIKKNYYGLLSNTFSERHLNCEAETINIFNDFAWVEFNWIFEAVFKTNNTPVKTKGYETLILKKIKNNWRIEHVHYSGVPVQ